MYVNVGLQLRSARAIPARWLTLAALSWAAAPAATVLAVGNAILAALAGTWTHTRFRSRSASPGWDARCWPAGPAI